MKKNLIVCFITFMIAGCATAQVNKDLEFYKYELECMGTGTDGTYLLKVWSYAKKARVAVTEGKRNAVHGVIFKGFGGGNNCESQKPLSSDPNAMSQYKDYFSTFFSNGGDYLKYVSVSNDGTPEVVRVGKEYKVGYMVSVLKDQLRTDLEKANVIRGLNSGF